MICGTEVVSAEDVLGCGACGSDEVAKLDVMPIDIVESKKPKKSRPAKNRARRAAPAVYVGMDPGLDGGSKSACGKTGHALTADFECMLDDLIDAGFLKSPVPERPGLFGRLKTWLKNRWPIITLSAVVAVLAAFYVSRLLPT